MRRIQPFGMHPTHRGYDSLDHYRRYLVRYGVAFVLITAIISTILFFAVTLLSLPRFGAIGANYGHIAFAGFTAIAMDIAWWRGSRAAIPVPNDAALPG